MAGAYRDGRREQTLNDVRELPKVESEEERSRRKREQVEQTEDGKLQRAQGAAWSPPWRSGEPTEDEEGGQRPQGADQTGLGGCQWVATLREARKIFRLAEESFKEPLCCCTEDWSLMGTKAAL